MWDNKEPRMKRGQSKSRHLGETFKVAAKKHISVLKLLVGTNKFDAEMVQPGFDQGTT